MKKKKTVYKRFWFFEASFTEREKPLNLPLSETIGKLKMEVYKALRLPQLVEWLYKIINLKG